MNIDNTYITIQGWMPTKLKLSGNPLLCFALIYGFSQDGESEFKGSLSFIADWLSCDKSTISRALQKLVDLQLVTKICTKVQGIDVAHYKANLQIIDEVLQNATPRCKMQHPVAKCNTYNNIDIYIDNNIDNRESEQKSFFASPVLSDGDDVKENPSNNNTPRKRKIAQKEKEVGNVLFKNSKYFAKIIADLIPNFQTISSIELTQQINHNADTITSRLDADFGADFSGFDLLYYFMACLRWSDGSNKKKKDWFFTMQTWICNDGEKAKKKIQSQPQQQTIDNFLNFYR